MIFDPENFSDELLNEAIALRLCGWKWMHGLLNPITFEPFEDYLTPEGVQKKSTPVFTSDSNQLLEVLSKFNWTAQNIDGFFVVNLISNSLVFSGAHRKFNHAACIALVKSIEEL